MDIDRSKIPKAGGRKVRHHLRLTAREAIIYNFMVAQSQTDFDLDEIARFAYAINGDRPENWRMSLSVSMRRLMVKTRCERNSIVRTTTLGRGHPAKYIVKFNPNKV